MPVRSTARVGRVNRLREGASTAGIALAGATTVAAALIALSIVFVLLDANTGNAIVAFVTDLGRVLVRPVGELFTPDGRKLRVTVNWGIAAALYLVVGLVLGRALRR